MGKENIESLGKASMKAAKVGGPGAPRAASGECNHLPHDGDAAGNIVFTMLFCLQSSACGTISKITHRTVMPRLI